MDAATIQAVRAMPLFATLTDAQLQCIELGEVTDLPVGTILVREGDPAEYFYVNLAGEIHLTRNYDNQEIVMAVNKPGGFMGEIPILLDAPWMATGRVSKAARLFRLNIAGFWRMLSTCPSVAREILRAAADCFRNIESYANQREKLISLGTMAAGLAHELNNPASAASRAASELRQATDLVQSFLCDLTHNMDPSNWEHLIASANEAQDRMDDAGPIDPLTRSDSQDALGTWLEQHHIEEG